MKADSHVPTGDVSDRGLDAPASRHAVKVKRKNMRSSFVYLLVAFAGLCLPVCARGHHPEPSPMEKRVVKALRAEEKILIDGHLSEKDWDHAEKARDFFRAQPNRGVRAVLKTEAMVLYDDATLYVGFRCFEPDMTLLRETLTRRDSRIWHDDAVEVVLDTYDDDRNGYVFGVNTLGTQMDEHIGNESVFTMTWDARWDVRVAKGEDFWTAEFAIPFSELRFSTGNSTWGINFWRAHPIDGESYSWSDTGGKFGRISEFGELRGLSLGAAAKQRKLGILPYATYRALEELPDDRGYGVDFLIQPSTNFTTNLTLNPDFSQLESDPTLIDLTSDRELSLPERRPFFRDGADLFRLPLNLFYSRRVQEIDLGLKTSGKIGDYNFAVLDTYGKLIDRYDGDRKKQANLLNVRVNRDLGERAVVGFMGVQKHQADRDLSLVSMNGRIALRRDWSTQMQYVMNHVGDGLHWAYHASSNWSNEQGLFANLSLSEIQDGFRPNETGLEDEAYRKWVGRLGYRHEYPEDRRLQSYLIRATFYHQTDEDQKVRERYSSLWGSVNADRFEFVAVGRLGEQRDDALFDWRELNLQARYSSTWSEFILFQKIGRRLDRNVRQTDLRADATLFDKATLSFFGGRAYWQGNRETWFLRFSANYQFTRKASSRIYYERIDERLAQRVDHNFNCVLDYEFTPESHFYLVFQRTQDSRRAIFAKLAYLFDTNLLGRR